MTGPAPTTKKRKWRLWFGVCVALIALHVAIDNCDRKPAQPDKYEKKREKIQASRQVAEVNAELTKFEIIGLTVEGEKAEAKAAVVKEKMENAPAHVPSRKLEEENAPLEKWKKNYQVLKGKYAQAKIRISLLEFALLKKTEALAKLPQLYQEFAEIIKTYDEEIGILEDQVGSLQKALDRERRPGAIIASLGAYFGFSYNWKPNVGISLQVGVQLFKVRLSKILKWIF
ncbi:MAG: hypothetical protein KAW12_07335 [Candidatus Aminicenantes bacterium]|nr:hypothetical protein [Candidatus Aminicenantes bacterium]